MGFVWVHADSFLHSVASPFHSFVTMMGGLNTWVHGMMGLENWAFLVVVLVMH